MGNRVGASEEWIAEKLLSLASWWRSVHVQAVPCRAEERRGARRAAASCLAGESSAGRRGRGVLLRPPLPFTQKL